MRVTVPDAEAMEALGRRIGRHLRAGDVVSLEGPLGAGKTTLTRGIAAGLGVTGTVASPTFVIARRHRGDRLELVHCDAYRVADGDELADVVGDLDEVVTVVEWGTRVVPAIADTWLQIVISRAAGSDGSDEHRSVVLVPHGWDDRDVASWSEP